MHPRPPLICRFPRLIAQGVCGLVLALTTAGALQAETPPLQAPQGGLFISPFGEPFRSPVGLLDWFTGADADRDGTLTGKEFTADGLRFHARLDANRDGRVDGFENTAYEYEIAPEILPQSSAFRGDRPEGRGPAPRARGLEGASTFGLLDEPQPVRGADLNYDGKITVDEQSKAAMRRFGLLDPEATGRLDFQALEARLRARQSPPSGLGRFFRPRPD